MCVPLEAPFGKPAMPLGSGGTSKSTWRCGSSSRSLGVLAMTRLESSPPPRTFSSWTLIRTTGLSRLRPVGSAAMRAGVLVLRQPADHPFAEVLGFTTQSSACDVSQWHCVEYMESVEGHLWYSDGMPLPCAQNVDDTKSVVGVLGACRRDLALHSEPRSPLLELRRSRGARECHSKVRLVAPCGQDPSSSKSLYEYPISTQSRLPQCTENTGMQKPRVLHAMEAYGCHGPDVPPNICT